MSTLTNDSKTNEAATKQILKIVCDGFLNLKAPTKRRRLVNEFHSPALLNELEQRNLLRNTGERRDEYMPTAASFAFCGDPVFVKVAKDSSTLVLRIAKKMYVQEVDKSQFTSEELLDNARRDDKSVSESALRLGLYLAQDFHVLNGWSRDQQSREVTDFNVQEAIVTIDPESEWEALVQRYATPSPVYRALPQSVAVADFGWPYSSSPAPLNTASQRTSSEAQLNGVGGKQTIFVSCGQRTDEERALGKQVCAVINSHDEFSAYFAETQSSLRGLNDNILDKLGSCVGFVAIMHPRGLVSFSDGVTLTRASVWVEQEIAIAAYIQHTRQEELNVAAYCHRDVGREGLRDLLQLNPTIFTSSDEVIADLERKLKGWRTETDAAGSTASGDVPSRGGVASLADGQG